MSGQARTYETMLGRHNGIIWISANEYLYNCDLMYP